MFRRSEGFFHIQCGQQCVVIVFPAGDAAVSIRRQADQDGFPGVSGAVEEKQFSYPIAVSHRQSVLNPRSS